MNTQRMLILGVAAVAAGAAALLARGLMGGGTQTAKAALPPPRPATVEVLVAASDLQPGTPLTVSQGAPAAAENITAEPPPMF